MVFANAEQALALAVELEIGVAMPFRACQHLRGPPWKLPAEVLILELDEIDDAIEHGVSATAILVDPGPDIAFHWKAVHGPAVRAQLDQDVAPALQGTAFDPVDIRSVNPSLTEGDGLGRDQLRRDG